MKLTPADLHDDEPITLAEACEVFFRGRLTKSSLRTEAKKGNLEIIRIAGRDFVTKNGINRMVEKCREKQNQQGSGSDLTPGSGSSKTETSASAQNALRLMLKQRKQSSQSISHQNTNQSAEVVRLK